MEADYKATWSTLRNVFDIVAIFLILYNLCIVYNKEMNGLLKQKINWPEELTKKKYEGVVSCGKKKLNMLKWKEWFYLERMLQLQMK